MANDFDWLKGLSGQNIAGLQGLQSGFAGIASPQDLVGRFNLPTSTKGIFDPLKKQLGIQRAGAQNRAVKAAGKSATPGMSAVGADVGYAGALQGLLGQEGQSQLGLDQSTAQMLFNVLSAKDQFGLGKAGGIGQLLGGHGNLLGQEYQTSGPSGWGIAGGVLGGLAPWAGPLASLFSPPEKPGKGK